MRVGRLLNSRTAQGFELPKIIVRPAEGGVPTIDYVAATDALLGLLVATAMPILRQIVAGQLTDLTEGREMMDGATRAKKLARNEAQLLDLELAEEAAIRAMEAAGIDVARRPDADPRALLAADASLPG